MDEDDLFGLDNEDYARLSAQSTVRPPPLPPRSSSRYPPSQDAEGSFRADPSDPFTAFSGASRREHEGYDSRPDRRDSDGRGWRGPGGGRGGWRGRGGRGWADGPHDGRAGRGRGGRSFGGGFSGSGVGVEALLGGPGQGWGRGSAGGAASGPAFQVVGTTNSSQVSLVRLGLRGHHDRALEALPVPQLQQPRIVGCLSRPADGIARLNDLRCLRRLRREVLRPEAWPAMDLDAGLPSFVPKREGGTAEGDGEAAAEGSAASGPPCAANGWGFADVLRLMRRAVAHEQQQAGGQKPGRLHFVTFRHNLNKMLGLCYDRSADWEVSVYRRQGTVYLGVRRAEEPRREGPRREEPRREEPRREGGGADAGQAEAAARLQFHGYAFERAVTEPFPSQAEALRGEPDAVDANVEFCLLLKTKVGPHRVLLAAEIDACDVPGSQCPPLHALQLESLVELKATMQPTHAGGVERFERDKLMRWWVQSFVAGVPSLVVGFRDAKRPHRLTAVERWSTSSIVSRVKGKGLWDANCILKFGDQVLTWLYGATKDGENYVLRFCQALSRLELLVSDECPDFIVEHEKKMAMLL